MADTVGLILKGVTLGLGAAVPIGPVNVQIARRALRAGFRAGFFLGCGAVTADVIYAVLSTVGMGRLAGVRGVQRAVEIAGGALLLYLGALCFRSEREVFRSDPIGTPSSPTIAAARSAYLTGLAMTLFNPMTLAFWFVAVPALVGTVADDLAHDLPRVGVGVFIGTLSWVVSFSAVLALAGRYRRNWWLAAADAAGGFAMLVFAAAALLSSLRSLL